MNPFFLDGSQSGGFTSVGDSSGSLTTISRHTTTTVTEIESFHRQASTQLTQNGTMVKDANGAWGWSVTGNGTSTTSGDWLVGSITGFNGSATTVWNKNGTSLTATSSLQSTTTEITGGGWQANNSFEFIGGNWTQTGTNLTKTVVYDRTLQASGSSGLTTVGGCLSLSMSASRTDNSTLGAYYGHTVSGSGDVTVWRHNGTSTVGWTTSANLTSGSGCSTSSEYFSSNFSESLTTNSTWSQSGGGPAIGANMAIYSKNSVYSGGSGGGYGGYGGSFSYSGGQNWAWSDPNLSTYDAHALSEIRITPNGPAEIGPVMFRSAPNVAFVMPPALVEDAEATAAVAKAGEGLTVQGVLLGLIPGSSLVDAYYDYQKGNYVGAAINGIFGLVDVGTLGLGAKAKVVIKSGGKAVWSLARFATLESKSLVDDTVRLVINKIDNAGSTLIGLAGGASFWGQANLLGDLKKASPSINVEHLFHGEINKHGKAIGFHHAGSIGHNDRTRILQIVAPPNQQGVYQATISVLNPSTGGWVNKFGPSTMFPNSWSRAQVLNEIRSSHKTMILKVGNKFEGISASGLRIRGYLDSSGNIITAFPLL